MTDILKGFGELFQVFFSSLNVVSISLIVMAVFFGLLFGLVFRPKARSVVLKFLPHDKRVFELPIQREQAVSVKVKALKEMPVQRFIKYQGGYTGFSGGFLKKPRTIFLAKEGTAYTQKLEDSKIKIPLDKTLIGIWGEAFYDTIPEKQRNLLLKDRVDVTIDLKDEVPMQEVTYQDAEYPMETKTVLEPLRQIREEDIKTEDDIEASRNFWTGRKQAERGQWTQWFFVFLAGFGVCAVLQIMGVLRI